MQKNAQADKRRMLFDNFEWPGLVNVGEVNLERGTIEVAEFGVKRKISDGVTDIPALELTYRCDRDTETRKNIEEWFEDKGTKEGTLIYTDGHGQEYRRQLLPKCEIVKKSVPAYDGLTPDYMKYVITVLPWDYIDVD